jgi:hypothetical protein
MYEIVLPRNPLWIRPAKAPNGVPWPVTSDYVAGYPRLNVFGEADVVADNSGSSNDLFVKLVDLDQDPATAVRVGFVGAKDQLSFRRVKPGYYDVRYRNLDTGAILKSPIFEVTVRNTDQGQQYQGWTIPLYSTINGTIYHTEITKLEF